MNLIRINTVLALLAAALAIPTWLQLRRDAETFVDVARVPLLFDGFSVDNVGSLRLRQPKAEQPPTDPQNQANASQPRVAYDDLVFVKTDKGWVFGDGELKLAPVNKERVEADVLTHLRSIRADPDTLVLADAQPEQLAKYGLDEAHAFVIQAVDATGRNTIAELLVGIDAGKAQSGTDAVRGVFVRKADSNDVVLYELDRTWLRTLQREQWLDRTLARIDPAHVRRLRLRNAASGGKTYTFERAAGKALWTAPDAGDDHGAVRQAEVEALLQRLAWITVQDYRAPLQRAGNLAALGLQPPQIELELTLRDGERERVLQLAIGNRAEGKNEFYVTSNESTFLMTWAAGMVAPFELDVKTQLFDPAAPKAEAPGDGSQPGGNK